MFVFVGYQEVSGVQKSPREKKGFSLGLTGWWKVTLKLFKETCIVRFERKVSCKLPGCSLKDLKDLSAAAGAF